MYEQAWVSSISKSCTATVDTNGDTANQVAGTDSDSSPKQRIAGIVALAGIDFIAGREVEFRRKDNGHDDTVDSDDFAENNGDQVLRSDSRSLDTSADNR